MAGQITKDIIDPGIEQRLIKIAEAVTPIIEGFKQVALEAERLSKSIGGAENLQKIITLSQKAAKSTEELTFYEEELAKKHQELGKLYAKLETAESNYNKKIIETKEALKQKNEAIKESITGAKAAAQAEKEKVAAEREASAEAKKQSELKKLFIKMSQEEADIIEFLRKENKLLEAQMKDLNVLIPEQRQKYEQLNIQLRENTNQIKQIAEAKKQEAANAAAKLKQEAEDRKKAAAAAKEQAKEIKLKIAAQLAEKGTVQQLAAVNAILKDRMSKLNVLIPEQKERYIQLSAAMARNAARMREISASSRGLNSMGSTLGTALKGLTTSFLRFTAVYLGFYQAIALVKNIFTLTSKLDSLNFAMKTVIKSQEEFARTQEFLATISENYGQDIVSLTERYTKFRAAAIQSNLSASKTQTIFDSAAKAAAVLGLRTDELNGVFLALEQMLSKGKVTTEELRRQLGERLPGAFGIMADAMGVSLKQLDKMLKAGDVMSTEALPKFAVALEKAYGIEAVDKVDTLAAANGRLATSWKQAVAAMNGSEFFINWVDRATNAVKGFKDILLGINEEFIRGKAQSEIYANNLIAASERVGDQARFDAISKGYDTEAASMEQNKAVLNQLITTKQKESLVAKRRAEELKTNDYEGYLVLTNAMTNYKGQLLEQFKLVDESSATSKQYIKDILLQANSIDILKQKIEELSETVDTFELFDVETYKKQLKDAENEFTGIGAIKNDDSLKKRAIENAAFYDQDQKNYRQYLLNQVDELSKKTSDAEILYNQEEANIKALTNSGKKASEEDQKRRQNALTNYQNYIEASILLQEELQSLDKKGGSGKKDDSLAKMKEQQKAQLAATKQHQQELIQENGQTGDELARQEYENNKELLIQQKAGLEEQLTLVKTGSLDYLKIKTEMAELDMEIQKDLTTWLIDEEKRRQKELEAIYKQEKDAKVEAIYSKADEERVAIAKRMTDELNLTRNKQTAQKRIEIKGAVDLLQVEASAQKQRIDALNGSYVNIVNDTELNEATRTKLIDENNKDRADATSKYNQLQEKLNETTRDGTVEVENLKREALQNTLSFIGDSASQAFDIMNSIYDAQMDRIESQYQFETSMAGQSQEKKVLAERKYDREKAKIQRKQAIAEKAQAALSVALNTAAAIISIWAQVPKFDFGVSAGVLTGIVSALGAAQMAVVLGTKIPEFAEGTDNAPARFIAGEEGQELIVKKDGSVELTPNKPTLYDDRSYIGSTILPHDETQKYLANYAVNHTYDMIDMTDTNRGIKKLIDVTKNKRETWVEGQYRFVRKGNRTSKYRL